MPFPTAEQKRSSLLRKPRSDGPLSAEELRFCREEGIEVGYDCLQIGWVCWNCENDMPYGIKLDHSAPEMRELRGNTIPKVRPVIELHLAAAEARVSTDSAHQTSDATRVISVGGRVVGKAEFAIDKRIAEALIFDCCIEKEYESLAFPVLRVHIANVCDSPLCHAVVMYVQHPDGKRSCFAEALGFAPCQIPVVRFGKFAFRIWTAKAARNRTLLDLQCAEIRTCPVECAPSEIAPEQFLFRPWVTSDAVHYQGIFDNRKVWEYMDGYPGPIDIESARTMISWSQDKPEHEVRAVVYRGSIIGQVRIMFSEVASSKIAELAYLLDESFWGRGLAVPMLKSYIASFWAGIHSIDRLFAFVRLGNEPSIRVLRRIGFREFAIPGLLEKNSSTCFVITHDEWISVHKLPPA